MRMSPQTIARAAATSGSHDAHTASRDVVATASIRERVMWSSNSVTHRVDCGEGQGINVTVALNLGE